MSIELTGNLVVHHPDRYAEDTQAALNHHANHINRLVQDEHNPDGEL